MRNPFVFVLILLVSLSNIQAKTVFQAFEGDGFDDWQVAGKAFGIAPVHGKLDGMDETFAAFANDAFALSAHGGTDSIGTLTSPKFQIAQSYITFLIAGGSTPGETAVQLRIDGEIVSESVANNSYRFEKAQWDVRQHLGKTAQISIVDKSQGPWGFIAADHFLFTDYANEKFPSPTKNGEPFMAGLVQAETLAGALIPPATTLTIEANHEDHQITSPTALTFDRFGSVYVSETHRFRHGVEDARDNLYWYLNDLAAKRVNDRKALHEKWKEKVPISYLTEKSEKIRKFTDTDNDGKMDASQIFADNFSDLLDGTAAGVFHHEGALYFACIPAIYKLTDTNGDGTADTRDVIEDGFGVKVSLSGHDLNGFTLGPDGRIYGTLGDRGMHTTTKEGREYDYANEGVLFRFEPDGSDFEVVHTGLRNPKEIAFDSLGNAITVDNNSDQGDSSRIVYLVEGGDSGWQMEHQAVHTFHRQIGLEERPPSRWMDERMWELENEDQPAYILPPIAHLTAGPSGLTYHPGAGFLEDEQGRFLICDYKGGASNSGIWSFALEAKGATMQLTDSRHFAWGIAATDVEYSFDGRVFITDFVTGWKSHEAGRLLSVEAGTEKDGTSSTLRTAAIFAKGFDSRTSQELLTLLAHPDQRVRLHAQIALTRTDTAVESLSTGTSSENFSTRLHSVWGLGILARSGPAIPPEGASQEDVSSFRTAASKALVELLYDANEEIRKNAVQALAESNIDAETLPLGKLLQDPSPRVRFATGITIGKLKSSTHFESVLQFIAKTENQTPYLRHAGVYAIQHASPNPRALHNLHVDKSSAVRLAAVVALRRQSDPKVSLFLKDSNPGVRDEAIRAIYDKRLESEFSSVANLLDSLNPDSWKPFMLRRLIHTAFRTGNRENAARLLSVAQNPSFPEGERKEALRLLEQWTEPFPVDQLNGYWWPLGKRDPMSITPELLTALPSLLQEKGSVLTEALKLAELYEIEISSLDGSILSNLISNQDLPPEARSKALQLYIKESPQDLKETLIEIAQEPNDQVALTAMKGLTDVDEAAAISILANSIESESAFRSQQSWEIIGSMSTAGAAELIVSGLDNLIQTEGKSPSAIELLEAARSREEKPIAKALQKYETMVTSNKDTLTPFNVSLLGGNVERGAAVFASHPTGQCIRCHKADEQNHSAGGDAGPNLAGIGNRHDSLYLLESLVEPAAVVAPGYGITAVSFKNGATLAGNLIRETPGHLDLVTPTQSLRIAREHIETFTPPVSAMPPMKGLLSKSELRDLVAWLESLDKSENVAQVAEPEPFDPDTLLEAD